MNQPNPNLDRGGKLRELADRCEAATAGDRELDGAIDRLVNKRPKHGDYDADENAIWRADNGYSGLLVRGDGFARASFCAREFTASLDSAKALVPKGSGVMLLIFADGTAEAQVGSGPRVKAATPALALTAACLRSLSTQGEQT